MKKYRSKIGLGIVLLISIVLGITSTLMIINHVWPGLIINIVVCGFIIYMFLTTYYIINGRDLIIICGFLLKTTININTIKGIKETKNPLSSPAASLDRIMIYYNKSDSVMISPKEKMDLISELIKVNDKIEVSLKKDKKI